MHVCRSVHVGLCGVLTYAWISLLSISITCLNPSLTEILTPSKSSWFVMFVCLLWVGSLYPADDGDQTWVVRLRSKQPYPLIHFTAHSHPAFMVCACVCVCVWLGLTMVACMIMEKEVINYSMENFSVLVPLNKSVTIPSLGHDSLLNVSLYWCLGFLGVHMQVDVWCDFCTLDLAANPGFSQQTEVWLCPRLAQQETHRPQRWWDSISHTAMRFFLSSLQLRNRKCVCFCRSKQRRQPLCSLF